MYSCSCRWGTTTATFIGVLSRCWSFIKYDQDQDQHAEATTAGVKEKSIAEVEEALFGTIDQTPSPTATVSTTTTIQRQLKESQTQT